MEFAVAIFRVDEAGVVQGLHAVGDDIGFGSLNIHPGEIDRVQPGFAAPCSPDQCSRRHYHLRKSRGVNVAVLTKRNVIFATAWLTVYMMASISERTHAQARCAIQQNRRH
ncbi:hypothetical protein ACVWW1_008975 [Bradyrhizobium sp. JR3.5]